MRPSRIGRSDRQRLKRLREKYLPNEVRNLSWVWTPEQRDSSAKIMPRNDKNQFFPYLRADVARTTSARLKPYPASLQSAFARKNAENSEALENVPTAKPFVILSEAKNLSVVLAWE
jgi:hypothetical protein